MTRWRAWSSPPPRAAVCRPAPGARPSPRSRSSFDAASRAYRLRLASAALLAPAGLLALLGLPFVLYVVLRLVRRRPLTDLPGDEVKLAGKAIGSLELRFVLGFYGVVAAMVAAGVLGGFGHGFLKPAAVTVVIGVFVLVLLLLVTAARRLRRLPAAEGAPWFASWPPWCRSSSCWCRPRSSA